MYEETVVSKPPLGLPVGSVRAIIVIMLIAIAGVFLYVRGSIPEFIAALVIMAVTFYFKDRSDSE
jgi:hypothetical protein